MKEKVYEEKEKIYDEKEFKDALGIHLEEEILSIEVKFVSGKIQIQTRKEIVENEL